MRMVLRIASRRSRSSDESRQNSVARGRRSAFSARRRLSSTVWFRTRSASGICGRCRASRSRSRPSRQIVRAVEHDVTAVRLGLAGDDVHHRCLAGAIGADDGAHLARLDRERQIVESAKAVERYLDGVEVEQGRCCARFHCRSLRRLCAAPFGAPLAPFGAFSDAAAPPSPCAQCANGASVPTMPRGISSVTATNRPPSMNSQ